MGAFVDVLGAVAPLAAGLLGYAGAGEQNAASAREAAKNRSFQERMSSTSHQREVKDLRAAGLNPILSANKGASSPGGNMATMVNKMSPALNSAMQAKRLFAELKQIEATTRATNATAKGTENDNVPGDIKAGIIDKIWGSLSRMGTTGKELFDLAGTAPPNFAGKKNQSGNSAKTPSDVKIIYDHEAYQKRLRKKAAESLRQRRQNTSR